MAVGDSERVQAAQKLVKTDPRKAEAAFKEITAKVPSAGSDAATREYEAALISLGQLYRDERSVAPPPATRNSPWPGLARIDAAWTWLTGNTGRRRSLLI